MIVTFSAGIVFGISLFQPINVYPVLFGLFGLLIVFPYSNVIGSIELPPSVLNVIVYLLTCHFAVIVIFSAGIVLGISWSQPMNVYPSFVGFSIFSISEPKSLTIELITEPPSVLNVIVYLLTCHLAVIVTFSAGIVLGISWSHPINVYPTLTGSAGFIITVPKSTEIGLILDPPSVLK